MSERFGRQCDEFILRPEQIAQFHRDGYVTLEAVLCDEELAPLEAAFDRFIIGAVPDMGRDFCDMSGPADRRFEYFSLVNAMLPRRYRPQLQGNVYEQRAASISRQLIGEVAALDYDQFLAKRPNKPDAAFTWHQDLGYWPTNTPDTIAATCSLALDDADSENGCLKVVPGSQKGLCRAVTTRWRRHHRPHSARSERNARRVLRDQPRIAASSSAGSNVAPCPASARTSAMRSAGSAECGTSAEEGRGLGMRARLAAGFFIV